MRWYTTSILVGSICLAAVSCGGDEEKRDDATSTVKLDGSRLSGCFASSDCKGDLTCYGAITNSMMATAGYCSDPCNPDPDEDPFSPRNICPPIDKMSASCSPMGQCRIDCTGGGMGDGECPAGMECRDVDASDMGVAWRCGYPIGTGRGKAKLWAECDPRHGDADCDAPNVCIAFGNGQNRRGFCSAPCTNDAECSAPSGVSARPLCAPSLEACSLDCVDGATCPNGMECIDATPGQTVTMRCRFVPPNMQGMGGDMPSDEMPPEEMQQGT